MTFMAEVAYLATTPDGGPALEIIGLAASRDAQHLFIDADDPYWNILSAGPLSIANMTSNQTTVHLSASSARKPS